MRQRIFGTFGTESHEPTALMALCVLCRIRRILALQTLSKNSVFWYCFGIVLALVHGAPLPRWSLWPRCPGRGRSAAAGTSERIGGPAHGLSCRAWPFLCQRSESITESPSFSRVLTVLSRLANTARKARSRRPFVAFLLPVCTPCRCSCASCCEWPGASPRPQRRRSGAEGLGTARAGAQLTPGAHGTRSPAL